MELLYPRCAGLDVHQKTVVACVRITSAGRTTHDVRTFETTTKALPGGSALPVSSLSQRIGSNKFATA